MILSRLFRAVALVSSVALVAPLLSSNAALAATATTTSVTATPSPAVAGQSVTLSATTSAPGTVTFSYDGQTVGTGVTTGSGTTLSNIQRWSYTGNSSAWRLASDSNGNIYVSTYNNMDAGGCRQVTKMLTSGGGVPCAPFESWNGNWVSVVGLAVSSTGVIYEAVYNGTAQNTIRSRTSIGATSTTFVSASALGVPSAGQGQITGMTIDASNNLYVTMRDLGEIKRITSAGVVTTYASGLGSPISSPVINPTTNVLYYINADKDIMQIPAGGGSPTLLTAASCNFETWNGSSWYGLGAQLAIDSAGFLYGAQCGGVTPLSTPNAEPITQINPSTGAMRQYLGWDQCMQASLPDGWAAGCGGNQALAFANGRLYTAGAHMGSSGVYGMNPSGYIATFTHTPTNPGVYSVGANLAPTDSGTFSASSGTGSLSVVPAAPSSPDLATSSDLGSSSNDNTTSDNTPRIEVPGNYSTGNTIAVTATKSGSTNVTCSYVIPATGCDLGTLADGTWSITATDSHPTSGASSASTALSITVDTSRPTAPTSVDLITASDTGTSTTDNNTNDNTPTMSATGGANGDTMTISATNGTTTVTCTYVIGSVTNCTLPTLTDGSWNISSTLTDPAGNTSLASSALPITIDATGPQSLTPDLITASDSGSSSTDNATSDSTPTLTLTGQSTGEVITMNATNGTTTISCSYTVGSASNCTLPTLTDGSWNISASVTDTAGNTGTTQSLDISVDTTPPTAPSGVDLVTASDTGNSSTDNNTNDTTPTMSASGGTNGDTMTISATNSGTTQSCSYVIGSATNCTLPTLTDGTWNISATLTDPAGNTSAPSTALPITIDGTAPSAPSGVDLAASSDSGASDSDNNTNDTTPTMSASGGTNGDTMTISATNSGTTVSCTYVIGVATNCTLPTLTDGTWNISATLTDPAGNTSAPSTALPITIDGTAPSAPTGLDLLTTSDTGSSNSDNFTGDNTPTLSAAGGTNGDTMTISATNGGTTVSCTYVIGVATNCTLPTLTDGTWNISARLTDPLGNESAASSALPVTIATSPPSRSAPDLLATSDNGSSNADNITNDSTPEISIPGALTGDVVTVSATNGTSTVTCTYTVGAATSCSLPTLSDGTWTVSASVTDAAGNTGPSTGSLSMTIDATPPTTPSGVDLAAASDTGASNTDNNTNDTTPTLSATGGANGDTMTISATKGNETKTCSYVVGVATSCDLPTLSDGTWSISVTATDSAGSTSAASPPMAINIGPDTSPSSVNDVTGNGLPSSTSTEMKPTVTSGKNSLTGRIRFAPHAAAHGAAAVVFTVYNTSGKIVSVITRRVKPTEKSASITVRNDGSLSVIRAHTTNKTGVSQSALRGANIMRGKTSAGRLPDGRPLLMGSLLGEVMYFKPNSAVLTPRTIALLNQLARTVNSQGGNLFVSGFARKNGIDTPKYLQNLSEQRALAVSMYLSAKGVRLWTTYRGFGAVTTEIGTPAERRVEVRWISVQ